VELRAFATELLGARCLAGKLRPPPARWTDRAPGSPVRWPRPARPSRLCIAPSRQVKVPPLAGMADPVQRGRIVHALANHELQAAELFAWALLAFPQAPAGFRAGLLGILADEQRHCRMYIERLAALGVRFGDYPVTGHFWHKLDGVAAPADFVCTMALTFESANLDFAADYAEAARRAGDEATALVLDRVHADEIGHVRFGWTWLRALKPADQSMWDAYLANVQWPLGPARARGRRFNAESRRAAGLDEHFIAQLAATVPKRPSGGPR
jgi:uncharacterized ferritin-like protein (DUF455 family)